MATINVDDVKARIIVEPLSRFYVRATDARGLVVGYGRLHESAVDGMARDAACST